MFESQRFANFRYAVSGSILVHVIAFAILSPFASRISQRAPDTVLEVELVPAQPRPIAPAVIEAPLPQHAPAQRMQHPRDSPKMRAERPATLALDAPSESRSRVEPVPAIEPAPVAPPAEPRTPGVPPSIETKTAAPAPPRETAGTTPPSSTAAYLNNPRPEYPRLARRNGEEGTVILRVLVTRQGLPARVETEKSSGSTMLDSAAVEAVKGWRFVPARKGPEPVEEWVRVPIVFRIQDVS